MWCAVSLWLGLSSVLGVSLAREFQDPEKRWQPSVTTPLALRWHADAAESAGGQAEAALQRTVMHCLGTRTLTRACHFENVYYEIREHRFVYFGPAGATPELFGEVKPGEPWLRLMRGLVAWKGSEVEKQFHMDWRGGEPLPPAHEVVTYRQPLHLRATMNTRSIGHLLRDNLAALIDLPIRFGRDPVDFDWVRWESDNKRSKWRREHNTAKHYRGLLNNRPSVTWQEVLDQALAGARRGVKYIQFSEIIGGQGPADLATQLGNAREHPNDKDYAEWAHTCQPAMFANMREVAYRNYGLKVASAAELDPFVLFLDGKPTDKRHLTNADDLIPKLQQKFPGVRMEHVQISDYPLEKQLDYLSKATVVVTNIGSRSFRLIYLPNGASVILVGPPEYAIKLPPRKQGSPWTVETIEMPFQEIVSCWAYIGYVQMLQYHVQSEAEVFRNKVWRSWKNARDTDIVLDEGKLSNMLRIALQRLASGGAYQGSGTLGSYDSAVRHD
eukprot:jgi/Ulvmu1/3988/UM183_0007.1